ncbi:alpha/beta hydrolase [Actinomyces wuliandei]|uniref:alpha/beta hydrolase n=1 Tax=Actinomyces wuliandei TaxID=2057743 RepID=UPI000FDC35C0|nr:alpha/beta hydrolase [Actinomyces wuliandei]
MSGFERGLVASACSVIGASQAVQLSQYSLERTRRNGLNGPSLARMDDGSVVEFIYENAQDSDHVVIFENGLGECLEAWDWVCHVLGDKYGTLRYHRAGYGRTTATISAPKILEQLYSNYCAGKSVTIVAHSIGAFFFAQHMAYGGEVSHAVKKVVLIDTTKFDTFLTERNDLVRSGRFLQSLVQTGVSTVAGTHAWSTNQVDRELDYRPDIRRAVFLFSRSLSTLRNSWREYRSTVVPDLRTIAAPECHVLAAEDNVDEQKGVANDLGARFDVVAGSAHHSIIGKLECVEEVCRIVWG